MNSFKTQSWIIRIFFQIEDKLLSLAFEYPLVIELRAYGTGL